MDIVTLDNDPFIMSATAAQLNQYTKVNELILIELYCGLGEIELKSQFKLYSVLCVTVVGNLMKFSTRKPGFVVFIGWSNNGVEILSGSKY